MHGPSSLSGPSEKPPAREKPLSQIGHVAHKVAVSLFQNGYHERFHPCRQRTVLQTKLRHAQFVCRHFAHRQDGRATGPWNNLMKTAPKNQTVIIKFPALSYHIQILLVTVVTSIRIFSIIDFGLTYFQRSHNLLE